MDLHRDPADGGQNLRRASVQDVVFGAFAIELQQVATSKAVLRKGIGDRDAGDPDRLHPRRCILVHGGIGGKSIVRVEGKGNLAAVPGDRRLKGPYPAAGIELAVSLELAEIGGDRVVSRDPRVLQASGGKEREEPGVRSDVDHRRPLLLRQARRSDVTFVHEDFFEGLQETPGNLDQDTGSCPEQQGVASGPSELDGQIERRIRHVAKQIEVTHVFSVPPFGVSLYHKSGRVRTKNRCVRRTNIPVEDSPSIRYACGMAEPGDEMHSKRDPAADVSVVVVSYNTADLIGACLKSVDASRNCRTETIVIDNASSDGSAVLIGSEFPRVRLIVNEENRGFGAACNQALPLCSGRYVLFLNPDAALQPDALSRAVSDMDRNGTVGLAGLKMVNPDGTLQPSVSYRYPGQRYCRDELQDLPGRIACVLGAAMLARAEILRSLGGFDEDFFLYGEDQDLCLRIRRKGHEIGYVKEAVAVHIGAQSERSSPPEDLLLRKIRAEYLFYEKHYRPDTIARIRRAERLKARWRLLTLKMLKPFTRHPEKIMAKEKRYRLLARATEPSPR